MNDQELQALREYHTMDDFDFIACQVEGTGAMEASNAAKALTIRFHLTNYAGIQALSEMAGSAPKNAIVNQLLNGAIRQVASRLSPEKLDKFERLHAEILGLLVKEAGIETVHEKSGRME